jgi:hypothetical protein
LRSGLYTLSGVVIGFSALATYSQSSFWGWGLFVGIAGAAIAAALDAVAENSK